MAIRSHAPDQEDHGIDLAPMLDFVLNLLIFFIITAVFVKEIGLTVSRPNSSATKERKEASSIVIRIEGKRSSISPQEKIVPAFTPNRRRWSVAGNDERVVVERHESLVNRCEYIRS